MRPGCHFSLAHQMIAQHSKLQKGAGLHGVTASASSHKRAQCILMQHSRPLDRCILDFISTGPYVSDCNVFLSTNGSDRHSINGFDPRDFAIPIKLNPPQNATDATPTWRSSSWRRDESISADTPYRWDCSAIRARRWFSYQGDDALWLFLPRVAVGSARLCV